MKDHFLIRFAIFAPFAAMSIFLLYWFRGHLRYSVICIAAAVTMYGVNAFVSLPIGKVPALGTKRFRTGVAVIALLLMASGFLLQMRE
jgi:hypothetical protein